MIYLLSGVNYYEGEYIVSAYSTLIKAQEARLMSDFDYFLIRELIPDKSTFRTWTRFCTSKEWRLDEPL